jgi:endonuclease/exonuclease/phosphatase family metal-dependent hydrolase
MQIVTWNIQYGLGRDGRIDLDRIARTVDGADIVGLQEVERFWERSGNVDQPAELARRLPGYWWVYGPSIDVLKQLGPGPAGAVRRQFGNMVLARHPIVQSRNHILPRASAMGPRTLQRAALEATIELPAGPLRFTSTHLCHLMAGLRLRQASALLEIHRRARQEGAVESGTHEAPPWNEAVMPPEPPADALLVGDLNATPDSPEIAVLAGEVHPRRGRLPAIDGFADVWELAGEGSGATIHADWAGPDGRRIDYLLASRGLHDRIRSARVDRDADGSDHQPLWAEVET